MKQYRALLILSKSIARSDRIQLDDIIESVPTLSSKQLIRAEAFYEEHFTKMATRVGLIAKPDSLVKALEELRPPPPNILYVPKVHIEAKWFSNFAEGRFRFWPQYPPHARIGIDLEADHEDHHMRLDWRMLEASLFEDMALLWNDVVAHDEPISEAVLLGDARIPLKRAAILRRSAARAAFALLEGYLNGLALDILLTRTGLTPAEREALEETRGDEKRFAPVKLRDKILRYPRIAARKPHPLFQETDCEALADVCRFERQHRDSLMHPTPRVEVGREIAREEVYYDISLDETRSIIDAVVGVIERIDHELDGMFGRVSMWLAKRGHDDRYPNTTFH